MNIKKKLKDEIKINLSEFAKELEISRPTLNSYIEMFERGEKISSDKHQLIFEKLFTNESITRDQFNEILNRYHRLLERDKILGTLDYDVKTTDLMASIIDKIKKDIDEKDYDEDIYTFINILIRSYKKEKTFLRLAKYFLYLNGSKSVSEIQDDEKAFISNCYKFLSAERDKKLSYNEEDFNKFLNRIVEIKAANDKDKKNASRNLMENQLKKMLDKKIQEEIQKQLELGVNIEDIDMQVIIEKVLPKPDSQ